MLLEIYLIDRKSVQVPNFTEFTVAPFRSDFITVEADKLNTVRLLDDATYTFKGDNTIMIAGKDILYMEAQ